MDKKFLISMFLALVTVGLFQYFYGQSQQKKKGVVSVGQTSNASVRPGQPIKVPTIEQLHKPLNLEVNFSDEKISGKEKKVSVETDHVIASFSTFGAILSTIDYKDHHGKNKRPLRTVYTQGYVNEEQRKKGCFLLALEEKTPYFYKHLYTKQEADKQVVAFQTQTDAWTIRKIYALHNDSYKIDLSLEFEPKGKAEAIIKPRIFFTAPFVHELGNDSLTGFMFSESSDSIEKKDMSQVHGYAWYWEQGETIIFGAEDRYFAHTLMADPNRFVQRAFYRKVDDKNLFPILEGPELTEKSSWTLSFYVGPKLYDHLNFVNNRLSEVLSFGWLSWFCKLILWLLDWLYNFIHNFGLAIIALTFLLRLPFVPLSIFSRRKMEEYQKHQPFITHIRTKYKKDLKMQQEEIMRYHREHNISPTAPMIGCLPLLLQLPILFALYRVLGSYLDLYQAPFFGWIVDLSAKDPFYILPVLMGASMIWQQSLAPTGDEKQKVIMWFMAIVMTVVFSGFAAGLVLYWLMNNVLTIAEDYARKRIWS